MMKRTVTIFGVAGVLVFGLTACGAPKTVPSSAHAGVPSGSVMTTAPTSSSNGTDLNSISNDLNGADNAATQSGVDTNSGDQAANTPDQPDPSTN